MQGAPASPSWTLNQRPACRANAAALRHQCAAGLRQSAAPPGPGSCSTWQQLSSPPTLCCCMELATLQKAVASFKRPAPAYISNSPRRPEAAQEVGGLGVLVAVDDVQPRTGGAGGRLHHRRLAGARLAHQQHRLLVARGPAGGCAVSVGMQHHTEEGLCRRAMPAMAKERDMLVRQSKPQTPAGWEDRVQILLGFNRS